ncbi:MAG: nucleotidyltransferase family protein [Planctomycetes bacterium]|nr:nucleotidyltransferase family protein [Planctomycetota bacterium]
MGVNELLASKRGEVLDIAARHGARNVRVSGSVALGDAGPDSDVDFLVEAGPVHSSWFPAGLLVDLEDLLGRRVHVLTEGALHPRLRSRILREAVPL